MPTLVHHHQTTPTERELFRSRLDDSTRNFLRALETGAVPSATLSLSALRALTATGGTGGDAGGVMAADKFVPAGVRPSYPRPIAEAAGALSLTIPRGVGNVDLPKLSAMLPLWAAEGVPVVTAAPTFGKVELRANRLAAQTRISFQLVAQSPLAESMLLEGITAAVAAEFDRVAFAGTGVDSEPIGLLLDPSITAKDFAGVAPTLAELAEIEETVRLASPGDESFAWCLSPRAARVIRAAGHYDDNGRTLLGHSVFVSKNIPHDSPTPPAIVGTGIFGRFADLLLAQWDGLQITVNPYDEDREGFARLTVESYCDTAILRGESFVRLLGIGLGE